MNEQDRTGITFTIGFATGVILMFVVCRFHFFSIYGELNNGREETEDDF